VETASPRILAVGSYPTSAGNSDVNPGDYHSINLRLPPFSLPEPLEAYDEHTPDSPAGTPHNSGPHVPQPSKHILVYTREQLEALDFEGMMQRALAMPQAVPWRRLRRG